MKSVSIVTVSAGVLLNILAFAAPAQAAFTPIANIFAGSNTYSTTLSLPSALLSSTNATAGIGPGWTGTLNLPLGLGYTETMTINSTANPGYFTVAGSGTLALGSSFTATKTFTGNSFDANTTYTLSMTVATGANLSLLSGLNFTLIQAGVTLADTSTGTGILGGALNLLNLFSSTTTASFQFQTPAVLNASSPIVLTMSGGTTVGLLNNSVSFTNASITANAVPEPRTSAMLGAGLLWAVLRGRSMVRKYRGLDA